MPPSLLPAALQPSPQTLRYTLNLLKASFLYHFITEYAFDIRETAGPSMLPTISIAGDSVLISKHYRRGRGIAVGDMVSVRHPIMPAEGAIKRVLGLPGDFVASSGVQEGAEEEGRGQRMMIQVPEGHCWIIGDNLSASRDSRFYGPLPLAMIKGKVVARVWPLRRRGWFENTLKRPEDGGGDEV
ncbi:mitochondrial inner membrane protease subunit 1 [Physcia stellaris]|nr:mitochondrial inner membrane protease subunit 1 [Physcia stellaris]